MSSMNLTEIYAQKACVATAHRGASGLYPENTLLAMTKAVQFGADLIEFDLRLTADGVPVVLHDATIDRTSDGKGEPGAYTLAELRKFNFSHYRNIWGERLEFPSYAAMAIPTFEDILAALHDKVCMNIQVYDSSELSLKKICGLYRDYNMFDRGFLAMSSFEEAEAVRKIDPEVEVAVLGAWALRATTPELKRCREFGCRFVQPPIETLTDETFDVCRKLGLYANVFYADTDTQIRELVRKGAAGILTNRIDILRETLDSIDPA